MHAPPPDHKTSTNSGEIKTSSQSSQRKSIYHEDPCSICMDDVSLLDIDKYWQFTCCGKVMHIECREKLLMSTTLSLETRSSCPLCRAKDVDNGTEEEIQIQIERLQKWSKRGKAWAHLMLGNRHGKGLGVKQDDTLEFKFYKLAADKGHHSAQFNLGTMYGQGRGVTQSDTLAFKYFKLAADQGFVLAQAHVGGLYYHGKGVEQNNNKALEYYTLASDQGNSDAQFALGCMDPSNFEGEVIRANQLAFDIEAAEAQQPKWSAWQRRLWGFGVYASVFTMVGVIVGLVVVIGLGGDWEID